MNQTPTSGLYFLKKNPQITVSAHNPQDAADHCNSIMERFNRPTRFTSDQFELGITGGVYRTFEEWEKSTGPASSQSGVSAVREATQ